MADGLRGFHKPVLREYQPERILGFLKDHPEYETAAVALSGDTGFFSGARGLLEVLNKDGGFEVEVIRGSPLPDTSFPGSERAGRTSAF